MERILKRYLWITGTGALIVLVAPWLVVIGMLFLIVPGLVLMLLPTAFLWGATFAFLWRQLKDRFDRRTAAAGALIASSFLFLILPIPAQVTARSSISHHDQPDVIPATPVTLSGDVRLDLNRPAWDQAKSARFGRNLRPHACDALCVALLMEAHVTSVTVNRSEAPKARRKTTNAHGLTIFARTYRLYPVSQCGGKIPVQPVLTFGGKLWGARREERERLKVRWQQKLETEFCIASAPPLTAYDFVVREDTAYFPPRTRLGNWSLRPAPTKMRYVEIRKGGRKTIARIQRVSAKVPSLPLMAWINGNMMSSPRFGWARTTIDDGKGAPPTLAVIDAVRLYTTLPQSLSTATNQSHDN